jgi:hypothetical protein
VRQLKIIRSRNIGAGVAKAVMHSNPITGFVQTIYDEYASRQWQQRREKWEEVFEEKLKDIQNDVDFQKIMSIPNFAQILANAAQGAMSDIEEDKVGLYVNTVINTIKNEDINNTKTHIFLNLLRDCTLLHIEILTEISKAKPPTSYNNSASNLLMDLRMKYKDDEFLEAILKNLSENHLIYTALKTIGPTAPTILTDLGKEFLQFISEQDIKK